MNPQMVKTVERDEMRMHSVVAMKQVASGSIMSKNDRRVHHVCRGHYSGVRNDLL